MPCLIKAEYVRERLTLTQQVLHTLAAMERTIEPIEHGEITLVIQDGKLTRVLTTQSRKIA